MKRCQISFVGSERERERETERERRRREKQTSLSLGFSIKIRMAAHRHQLFTYALQPSLAAASTASPAPPPPQPQPQQNLSLSSLYASSAADRYYPDATFRFLSRDGSESLTNNYQPTVASSSSSSAMYHHHLPNAASHLAYPPQLMQHQEAWPPGVEPPAAAAVEPLPPGVKRTSEGLSFYQFSDLHRLIH